MSTSIHPAADHTAGRAFHAFNRWMERAAIRATQWSGSSWAFMLTVLMVVVWLLCGPVFHYSDTWQLVMNTIGSNITFLMVFLIQRSQNKDALAMQIKLNELLASIRGASNRLINVEELSEEEVRSLHERYQVLARRLQNGTDHTRRSSIEQTLKDREEKALECERALGREAEQPASPPR